MTPNVVQVSGVVVSVQGLPAGQTESLADPISYTVDINIPEGVAVRKAGVVPSIWRWAPPLKIRPLLLVGKAIGGWRVGGVLQWDFIEPPAMGDCTG